MWQERIMYGIQLLTIWEIWVWPKDGVVTPNTLISNGTLSISLLGINPVTVVLGSTYTDAGATATDSVDGDLTSSIVTVNPVDVNTLGNYTVMYNVTDSTGNTVTTNRSVMVVS